MSPQISFEYFPPPEGDPLDGLIAAHNALTPLNPSFATVTYGAGGSTQSRTLRAVHQLAQVDETPIAAHLTCVGATREQVAATIDQYLETGVRHIVALRGDPPAGSSDGSVPGGYRTAAELVAGIRSHNSVTASDDFEISVAAYPEVHPRATSASSDLESLKQKLDAGATRAITQFFFDPEMFLRFRDHARIAGINQPLVPGIMPIPNLNQIARFSGRIGATIPEWLDARFADQRDGSPAGQMIAASCAIDLARSLLDEGCDHLHFYTMNQPELTFAVCRSLVAATAGARS